MHYVCVENGQVIGTFNYKPEVPDTVKVYEISLQEHDAVINGSHYFDIPQGLVLEVPKHVAKHRQAFLARAGGKTYLAETDWKVLRHIREKALGLPTSMSDDDYLAMEHQRHEVAKGLGT